MICSRKSPAASYNSKKVKKYLGLMPLAISILGATGKMGKRVLSCALQDPELRIAAATSRSSSCDVKQALSLCDVAIDFSTREATLKHVDAALAVTQSRQQSVLVYPSPTQETESAAGREVSQLGTQIARKNLNVQPTIKIPRGPLYPLAWGAEALARVTGKEPFLTVDALTMAQYRMFFSSAKAEQELGYQARPYESAVAEAIDWFRAAGYLK